MSPGAAESREESGRRVRPRVRVPATEKRLKTQKEITQEVRRIRERVRGFSGYWIGEAAAAIQALEWASGKRKDTPSEDIRVTGGEHERIAAALVKSVEKPKSAPAKSTPAAGAQKAKKSGRP